MKTLLAVGKAMMALTTKFKGGVALDPDPEFFPADRWRAAPGPEFFPAEHWRGAPFGSSKNSVAGDRRRAKKRAAVKRAKRRGQA